MGIISREGWGLLVEKSRRALVEKGAGGGGEVSYQLRRGRWVNSEVQNGIIVEACYEVYFQLKFNFNLFEVPKFCFTFSCN